MTEISLHILDIAQNSIKADAKLIEISVAEDIQKNILSVTIKDDGCGMSSEFLKDVTNPFRTTRTTRRVGLGISMFKSAAELTGGKFEICSEPGKGTELTAEFVYDSIDRQPLGDMVSTMITLINAKPDIDYLYIHSFNDNKFEFDTRQIKSVLGEEISLCEPEILHWIEENIQTETENLYGGAQ